MKGLLLGLGLVVTTSGGVIYLLGNTSGKHCGPCAGTPAPEAVQPAPVSASAEPSDDGGGCEACKASAKSANRVYDVADLKAGFAAAEPAPFVSFDEPPLAKPKNAAVTAVSYEAAKGVEVLPPPREEK